MRRTPSWRAVELLLRIARDGTRGLTLDERLEAIADPLLELIPGASLSVVVVHPERGCEAAWFRNGNAANAIEYGRHYRFEDPMWPHLTAAPGLAFRLSDTLSSSHRFGSDAFTGEFLPRHGLKHLLGLSHPMPGGAVLGFCIHRERGGSNFSTTEVAYLRSVSPDIRRLVATSLVEARVRRLLSERSSRAHVVSLDAVGQLAEADAGGAALWGELRARAPGLEGRLVEVAAACVARGDEHGALEDLLTTSDGNFVRARLLVLGAAAPPGLTAILEVLTPGSADFMDAIAARVGLTAREKLVALDAIQGLATKQIAARLGIAPPTVCSHLGHIFAKTGVRGRTELAQLFRFPGERPA